MADTDREKEIVDQLAETWCDLCRHRLLTELGHIMGAKIAEELGGPFELRLEGMDP